MDTKLGRETRNDYSSKILTITFYLPVFWLIYHLLNLKLKGVGEDLVLAEFIRFRDILYIIYTLFAVLLGVVNMLSSAKSIKSYSPKPQYKKVSLIQSLIPILVLSIILTTFSYSVSSLLFKLTNLFN